MQYGRSRSPKKHTYDSASPTIDWWQKKSCLFYCNFVSKVFIFHLRS